MNFIPHSSPSPFPRLTGAMNVSHGDDKKPSCGSERKRRRRQPGGGPYCYTGCAKNYLPGMVSESLGNDAWWFKIVHRYRCTIVSDITWCTRHCLMAYFLSTVFRDLKKKRKKQSDFCLMLKFFGISAECKTVGVLESDWLLKPQLCFDTHLWPHHCWFKY